MSNKLKYLTELDGVRGIAALMVMLFHFFHGVFKSGGSLYKKIHSISIFGQTGVILFFVLSGFLITRILLNAKDQSHYFKNFYIRRSLRIFPLYYLTLILFYFLFPYFISGIEKCSTNQQYYYWFYFQNIARTFSWDACGPGHLWTLAIEEHFYLFWPFVIFFFDDKNIAKVIAVIMGAAILVRIYLLSKNIGVFYFTFSQMDSLAIGGILAIQEKNNKLYNKESFFKILLLLLLLVLVGLWVFVGGIENAEIQIVKPLLISAFYYLLIGYVITTQSNIIKSFFNQKSLTYTGKISYGLYVYHPFVYLFVYEYVKTDHIILDFFICMLSTYAISTISYYLIENQFIKLKSYFTY